LLKVRPLNRHIHSMLAGSMLVSCVCLYMLMMISFSAIHLIALVFCPRDINFIHLERSGHQSDIRVPASNVTYQCRSHWVSRSWF